MEVLSSHIDFHIFFRWFHRLLWYPEGAPRPVSGDPLWGHELQKFADVLERMTLGNSVGLFVFLSQWLSSFFSLLSSKQFLFMKRNALIVVVFFTIVFFVLNFVSSLCFYYCFQKIIFIHMNALIVVFVFIIVFFVLFFLHYYCLFHCLLLCGFHFCLLCLCYCLVFISVLCFHYRLHYCLLSFHYSLFILSKLS